MVRLVGTLGRLRTSKVLVAGDLILDTYTVGKVNRISPEAPVAVVRVHHEEHRPGGSGNVGLNLRSLATEVIALGRVGNDGPGKLLKNALENEGIDVSGIFVQQDVPTPVKNRIIAENQQIVRVDREQTTPLSERLEQDIIASLPMLLEEVDLVAISDYGKGFFTPTLLAALIEHARERGIPVLADPKGMDFARYRGATVVKPNLSEAIAAAGLPPGSSLDAIAAKILAITEAETIMITRSQDGISTFDKNGMREDFPVRVREVRDVTGAGDTVLATLACALASGLSIAEATQLANVAAGIAIERFGCARISLSDIARRVLEADVANKVFDEEHLFALQQALEGRKVAVLGLDSADGLTPRTFAFMRQMSQREEWTLLVYFRDANPDVHLVEMLVSLREVDFIILKSESLRHLCACIEPDEVFVAEGADIRPLQHSGELVTV
ncbi:MAG: bifunctional ADP-heptose synthase [Chlamydiales bacterium]|nr:bifunctional ADP-heptose synthase [Chlamydiales bacterium]